MQQKAQWTKAQLIVLGRATPEEGVLGLCKVGGEDGPPDVNGVPHQCSSAGGSGHCDRQTSS